ncbi:MAG: Omp28-related outer membrane protein [Bacteroidetes bacterium]|nr:Omp28-related outer membrane protein [Bacteroidota bacterium]
MKKTITLLAACIGLGVTGFAQTFTQDFESTTGTSLPSGWTQNSPSVTGWITGTSSIATGYLSPIAAHTRFAAVVDAKNPGANANDTLFSPTFSLASVTNAYLSYDQMYFGYAYTGGSPAESADVLISTDGGGTWSHLAKITPYGTWNTDYVSLMSYSSSSVKLAFRYSDGNGGSSKVLAGLLLDNIKVFSANSTDLGLSSIYLSSSNVGIVPGVINYAASGSTIGLSGTVFNNSVASFSAFTVMYSLNGAAPSTLPITATAPILPFTYYTWSGANVTLPAALQVNTINAWVIAAGDINILNDSNSVNVTTIGFLPTKKISVEEATGTWCGWCVRGIVFLDSMAKTHPGAMSLIAVHNSDPMVVSAYDSWMGTELHAAGTGYPSIVVDRRQTLDPSNLFDVLNFEGNYFGYADITLGTPTVTSHNNFSVPVTVKPSIDLSGDYRLVLVLTEDGLSGTDDATHKWSQHNYYSGGSQGPMGGFESKASDVAGQIYNHVARSISPSVSGTSGVLPASMSASSTYNATLTATLADGWVSANMHAIVMLVRNSDGQVLNTQSTTVPLGVANVTAGINAVRLFPNPANEQSTLAFSLQESNTVQITVTDVVGRTVYTSVQQMTAGNQQVTIPTASLTPGLYNVKLQTAKGGVDARLSVVK